MPRLRTVFTLWIFINSCLAASAASAKIIKVLPHYLDRQGRFSLSPSLYERDAYQAFLRRNLDQRSALRFDVQWKANGARASELKLRLEIRGTQEYRVKPLKLEQPLKRKGPFGSWSAITLEGEAFQKVGEVIAWRVSLWAGDELFAEYKSFLW